MKARYDIQLMVRVSKMYYIEELTQDMIAKETGISRSTVSMILSEAKNFGIVEIRINDPKDNVKDAAEELKGRFGLKDCFVIPTEIESIKLITQIVASQGAEYAENILVSHSTVGIAWGMTCYEFMLSFANKSKLSDINVVPLIGGTTRVSSEYQLNEMVRMFAEKVQGSPSFIYAPAIAASASDKELYMQSISMKSITEKWSIMNTAIISVGAPPEYYDNRTIADPEKMKLAYEKDDNKPVGDICARRFNIKGKFIEDDYSARIVGIAEDNIRNINNVICIAAGRQKVLSIIGALRTKIIDYLVTDEATALSVMKLGF
jgi:deoxyribonucleoside regulator